MHLEDARALARRLLDEHGLGEWLFDFDNAKRRLGACWLQRRRITLSREFVRLNDVGAVRDVILHEIAHALTPGDGHGKLFKAKARELGCTSSACVPSAGLTVTPGRYRLECPHCGRHWVRYRRPPRRLYCSACCDASLAPLRPLKVARAATNT